MTSPASHTQNKYAQMLTNTYSLQHPMDPFLPQSNTMGRKKKKNLNADICHMHLACLHWGESNVSETLYFLLLDQTKLPWISQLWVNKRATRLGQIGLMAGLCLPFAVIYSCVYSSCRYPLWSSVPSIRSCPSPRCQRGNTVLLHQVR